MTFASCNIYDNICGSLMECVYLQLGLFSFKKLYQENMNNNKNDRISKELDKIHFIYATIKLNGDRYILLKWE